MGEKFFNLLGAIVTLGTVAVIASSPQMAGIIRAFGDAFSGSIDAAQRV